MPNELWRDPSGGREEYEKIKGILLKYDVPEVKGQELEKQTAGIVADLAILEAKAQWRQRVLGRLVTLALFGAAVLTLYLLWGRDLFLW